MPMMNWYYAYDNN